MPHAFGQVTLSWNKNVEADLAGYRIHYGLNGPTPTLNIHINVNLTATPNTPSVTLPDPVLMPDWLLVGDLVFAVSAYDSSNNESALSTPFLNIGVAPKLFPLIWP